MRTDIGQESTNYGPQIKSGPPPVSPPAKNRLIFLKGFKNKKALFPYIWKFCEINISLYINTMLFF